jgi:hypothetical protein
VGAVRSGKSGVMAEEHGATKQFDAMGRDELELYAKNWSIEGTNAMSDTELRKRLRDADGTTGVAAEADGPVVRKGDPGRGPRA